MSSPKYHDENGNPTTANDRSRLLWYSARCGYWTDDWSKVKTTIGGIPCCPECGCVGLQVEAGKWEDGIIRFEKDNNPGYSDFVSKYKEKCLSKQGGWMKVWEAFKGTT